MPLRESMGFGLFYGAIIVILLFNLIQWLMIKEAVYGQYVGFNCVNFSFSK